jgi:hypothetical protein
MWRAQKSYLVHKKFVYLFEKSNAHMEDLNCILNDTKLHDVHKQQNYNSLQ